MGRGIHGDREVFYQLVGHGVIEKTEAEYQQTVVNPLGVIAEAAELLGRYDVQRVTGDRYASEFPREGLRAAGIE